MNIYTSETEYLKTEVQRLRALVRAQQITIDKLEAQPEQDMPKIGCVNHDCAQCKAQLEQKRPPNCGTGYCSCIECVMGPVDAPQEKYTYGTPLMDAMKGNT